MGVTFKIDNTQVDGTKAIGNWISDRLDKEAIEYANHFGKHLKENRLTTAQIRNVFGEVRRIQMKMMSEGWEEDSSVLLLRPKLAYAARRAEGRGAGDLADILSEALKEVTAATEIGEIKRRFQNFADFFEAVLAYHKYHGGN